MKPSVQEFRSFICSLVFWGFSLLGLVFVIWFWCFLEASATIEWQMDDMEGATLVVTRK